MARFGLTQAEAGDRLRQDGPNAPPNAGTRRLPAIVRDVVSEPMFASLSVVITVIQEARSEHVLDALRDLTNPRALVCRDGQWMRIAGRDVVRGDFVGLAEGDHIPADRVMLQVPELQTDESLLTGESVPVSKRVDGTGATDDMTPGGDNSPFV